MDWLLLRVLDASSMLDSTDDGCQRLDRIGAVAALRTRLQSRLRVFVHRRCRNARKQEAGSRINRQNDASAED